MMSCPCADTQSKPARVYLLGQSASKPDMNGVQALVETHTRKKPNLTVNPDEVVALGAAVQAGVLSGMTSMQLVCLVLAQLRCSVHTCTLPSSLLCAH